MSGDARRRSFLCRGMLLSCFAGGLAAPIEGVIMLSSKNNAWFQVRRPTPDASLRLFCFPYAGGSASVFHGWSDTLPRDVEVVAVQYPGHGYRFGEPLISRCADMIDALMPSIVPWLDRPYAFFGHSNGALVSFELALALQRAHYPGPVHHFLSGKSPPHLPDTGQPLHQLSDEAFMRELSALGGTPQEFLDDPELMRLLLPMLRADFAISETYSYTWKGDRLVTQASILYGRKDDSFDPQDLAAWPELIDGKVDSAAYDGDHFFIHSHKQAVLEFVDRKLRAWATAHQQAGAERGLRTMLPVDRPSPALPGGVHRLDA